MSLPFIRVEYQDALMSKKDILSSQADILNIARKISSYKRLRKIEFSKKTLLKRRIKHSIAQINNLMREMPEIESEGKLTEHREEYTKRESNKKKSIESELKEIQEKLSRLNQ